MRISAALLGFVVWLCPFAASSAEDGALVALPGAVWAIVPPPDFVVVNGTLALFKHPSGAVIMVQDSPKRLVLREDFDVDPAQAADTRVDELTEMTVAGNHGFLAVAHVASRNATMIMLAVEGKETNGNIIASVPDGAASAVSMDAVRKAVLSAVEQPRTVDDRLADLPYSIGDMSGMHIVQSVPGGVVTLTDGPLDDAEAAYQQSFATLVTMETGDAPFDPTGELGAMVQRLKQQYPDATIVSSQAIDTDDGKMAEIRYERSTTVTWQTVGGVTWAKPLGGSRALVMIAQYPRGDEAAFARLVKLRDGVKAK